MEREKGAECGNDKYHECAGGLAGHTLWTGPHMEIGFQHRKLCTLNIQREISIHVHASLHAC